MIDRHWAVVLLAADSFGALFGTKLRVEALTGISDADLEVFYRVMEVILANLLSASAK